MTYEYQIISDTLGTDPQKRLNALGADGWRLVGRFEDKLWGYSALVFMRELSSESRKVAELVRSAEPLTMGDL